MLFDKFAFTFLIISSLLHYIKTKSCCDSNRSLVQVFSYYKPTCMWLGVDLNSSLNNQNVLFSIKCMNSRWKFFNVRYVCLCVCVCGDDDYTLGEMVSQLGCSALYLLILLLKQISFLIWYEQVVKVEGGWIIRDRVVMKDTEFFVEIYSSYITVGFYFDIYLFACLFAI